MLAKFDAKKRKLLASLSQPPTDYKDASPKGFVDEGVCELIGQINDTPGFVTTSSCAGRVAVYLDGPSKMAPSASLMVEDNESDAFAAESNAMASAGGKGGGRWLFSSHSPVDLSSLSNAGALLLHLGLPSSGEVSFPRTDTRVRYVHFKFEPMILHILAASVEEAQAALHAAVQSGFRESGISGLLDSKGRPSNPMVAVRSSGLALDSIIGFKEPDSCITGTTNVQPMVSESYLQAIVQVANDRFKTNEERRLRFASAWRQLTAPDPKSLTQEAMSYHESSAARKERKRMEGLERKHQMGLVGGAQDGLARLKDTQTIENEDDFGFDILGTEDSGRKAGCI